MSETKKFLTKEYLLKALVSFNKNILKNKYFSLTDGNDLTNKVDTLIGDNVDKSIKEIMSGKVKKIFVDELPSANDETVDEDALYILKDKNAVDENTPYFIYTKNNDMWSCISAPNYIHESEKINFTEAFERAAKKFTLRVSFISAVELINYLKTKTKTYYNGYEAYSSEFLTTDFTKCKIVYCENEYLYYYENPELTSPTESINLKDDEVTANELANSIQNPEGGLKNGD